MKRTLVLASAVSLVTLAACDSGGAGSEADYPPGDVTILVPYAAGGATDTLARQVAEALGEELGATFVVENQPGAGGATAISSLLQAPDDGTTLAVLAAPTFLIPAASGQADYELDDLRPVGVLSEQPIILMGLPDNSDGFLESAESERRTVGTNGPDTAAGIDVNRLSQEGGLDIEQVPFGGQSELVTNLLGGNLDAIVVNTSPEILDEIDAGAYEAIATFAPERLPYLPDTPTFAEQGYDMATNATSQFGLFASAEIEDSAFSAVQDALESVLSDPELRETIGDRYVSEEFVDGETWSAELQETQEAYVGYFEGQE